MADPLRLRRYLASVLLLALALGIIGGVAWSLATRPSWRPGRGTCPGPTFRADGVVMTWTGADATVVIRAATMRPGQRAVENTPIRLSVDDRIEMTGVDATRTWMGGTERLSGPRGWLGPKGLEVEQQQQISVMRLPEAHR